MKSKSLQRKRHSPLANKLKSRGDVQNPQALAKAIAKKNGKT